VPFSHLGRIISAGLLLFFLAIPKSAPASFSAASVQDGAGSSMSNAVQRGLCSIAQPGGVDVSAHENWTHYAGFLAAAPLRPDVDTDQDGLCDEFAADNDADGMGDIAEAAAGTSSTNKDSVLAITDIKFVNSQRFIFWQGGQIATQFLMRCTRLSATGGNWVVIHTNLPPTNPAEALIDAAAGSGPWFYRIVVPIPPNE
jgi:hypothetical protein